MPIGSYRGYTPNYTQGYRGSAQSAGFARPADPVRNSGFADAFGDIANAVTKGAVYNPANDPAFILSQERADKLKADQTERVARSGIANELGQPIQHYAGDDGDIASAFDANERGHQRSTAALHAYGAGLKQEDLADLFLNQDAQAGNNGSIGRSSVFRHGGFGKDTSFTEGRQTDLRNLDETSKQTDRATQEASSMDRTRFSEGQADARNAATIGAEGDRAAAKLVNDDKNKALDRGLKDQTDVGVKSLGDWDNEINSQAGIAFDKNGKQLGGPTLSPDVRTAIRSKAIDLYTAHKGSNPTLAVAEAIRQLVKTTPAVDRFDFGTGLRDSPETMDLVAPPLPISVAKSVAGAGGGQPKLAVADDIASLLLGGTQSPPAASPMRVQPAAAAAAPPAPALPAQRQPGATYTTPKGPMKWTGTGWVPA